MFAQLSRASPADLVRRLPPRPQRMRRHEDARVGRAATLLAGVLTLVAVCLATVLIRSDLTPGPGARMKVMAMVGAGAFFAAGFLARRRHSTRGLWPLMLVAGCAWLLASLRFETEDRAVFTCGMLGAWIWGAVLAHIALAFPTARLPGPPERAVVGVVYLAATVVQAAWVLLAGSTTFDREACERCPAPLVSLGPHPDLATSIIVLERVVAGVAAIGVGLLLARRWWGGSSAQRHSLAPILAVGGAAATCFAASVATLAAGWAGVGRAMQVPVELGFVLLPFAFLGGLWRTRIQRTFGVSRFVEQLDGLPGPDHLTARLASALGDDTLAIVYWLPTADGYVDRQGRIAALPPPGSGRAVTEVELDGHRVAALIHDAALCEEAGAVRAAGRAAALWLERDRLEAERRAYVSDLRESRARLVAASDTERRRIQRDLHDGAQQRLAAMLLRMKLERRRTRDDPSGQSALLDELEQGLAAALEELRALAAGILPPVLSDRGLGAALEELASRTPLPVLVDLSVRDGLGERVEVAAYFVAAEALANVVKHSNAHRAFVSTRRERGRLVVEVSDDGDGGAVAEHGTGLRGLSDRLEALGGQLSIHSPAGTGTTLVAEIPCES